MGEEGKCKKKTWLSSKTTQITFPLDVPQGNSASSSTRFYYFIFASHTFMRIKEGVGKVF